MKCIMPLSPCVQKVFVYLAKLLIFFIYNCAKFIYGLYKTLKSNFKERKA